MLDGSWDDRDVSLISFSTSFQQSILTYFEMSSRREEAREVVALFILIVLSREVLIFLESR